MTIKVSAVEAESDFAHLLDAVANGEDVVIEREGEPVARVEPLTGARRARFRALGSIKYKIPDEFFEPPPDDILAPFEAPVGGRE